MVVENNVSIIRKITLKYLGVKGDDVTNIFRVEKNDLKKICI
jgi:hypothetical protein